MRTEKADPERGQNGTAAAAEGPECAKELAPGTAGLVHFEYPPLSSGKRCATIGCRAWVDSLRDYTEIPPQIAMLPDAQLVVDTMCASEKGWDHFAAESSPFWIAFASRA